MPLGGTAAGAGTRQLPDADDDAVEPDGGTRELCDLLGRFRASGGSVRFAASGPEQQLSPQCRAAVRSVLWRVQTGAAEALALSVTLTWSPQRLDLLVVLAPSHGARTACLDGDDLEGPSDLVHLAGGTIRLGTPRCGGSVLAVVLPVPGLPGARIGR